MRLYCILFSFLLLLYTVCSWHVHNLYVVKYYNIADTYVILRFSYWLILYLEAVSSNMDFRNKKNWIENWKLSLIRAFKEKQGLWVSDSRVVARMLESKSEEVTESHGELHNEEINNPCSSPNIFWIIK
jgi:hypothetical protein